MEILTAQTQTIIASIDLLAYSGALIGATAAIILGRLALSKKQ